MNIPIFYYSARVPKYQSGFLDTNRKILFNKACALYQKLLRASSLTVHELEKCHFGMDKNTPGIH
jgi:hypothetical protein